MQYIIAFLEGIITFISPCLLPMLPIYISYFAGGGERSVRKTLTGALGFVTGFSIIFVILGALAGTVGSFLREHQTAVNIVPECVHSYPSRKDEGRHTHAQGDSRPGNAGGSA